MANTNPQAVRICNEKIRNLADKAGQFYNLCKAYQAEALAENWSAMFVGGSGNVISDGAETDGRSVITDADVTSFIAFIGAQITAYEATSNANRNLVMKMAVNPERY